MKKNGLLAAAAAVFALTNQTVRAAEDVDVVVLRCDIFGTPREQRVVTDTRSVGAGTPSAILDNCAQVLGDLLAAGFTNEETLGTDGGVWSTYCRRTVKLTKICPQICSRDGQFAEFIRGVYKRYRPCADIRIRVRKMEFGRYI